jgi:hypothetical protein
LGILIGGVLILIRVGDFAVVWRCFFLGLFLFIKYLLAMRRRATGSCRGTGALTWARKRSMSSSNGSLIRSIPFGKWVIKLRQLMVWIRRKPQVTLNLNNVTTVFIYLLSCSLAHAEDALKGPLDNGIMVTTARRRWTRIRWSWVKPRVSCSTDMKRRGMRCITGPRTKM